VIYDLLFVDLGFDPMLKRLWSVMQKEFIQLFRDRRTLLIMLTLPVAQLVLFGYAVETQVDHLPTVVVDYGRDAQSWRFVDALVNTGYFDVYDYLTSEKEVIEAIDSGRASAGVIVPVGFAAAMERGETAQALVIVDGSDPNVAQSALNAAATVGQDFSVQVMTEKLNRHGLARTFTPPLDLRTRLLYNPNMKSINFMLPGILGMILQQQSLLLTAFAIVREREMGTIEQILVTPIRPWELTMAKILPYVLLTIFNVGTTLLVGLWWFGVPFKGDVVLFWALSFLFLFTSLGLGMLISTVSTTQIQAQQLSFLILLPSLILSGYIFPRESMPRVIHDIGYVIPLTYYLQILRGIMLKGIGVEYLWPQIIPLAVFGAVVFVVSAFSFRQTLD
jgi:ABC-2 type transport system permease protein